MITTKTRTVFRSDAVGRDFLTLRGAAFAEARRKILKKYPTERGDWSGGDPGFHWRELPNADKMLRRLARVIMRVARSAPAKGEV